VEPNSEVHAVREQLQAIYTQHNPRKLADVDALLSEWQGDEIELLHAVKEKYLATNVKVDDTGPSARPVSPSSLGQKPSFRVRSRSRGEQLLSITMAPVITPSDSSKSPKRQFPDARKLRIDRAAQHLKAAAGATSSGTDENDNAACSPPTSARSPSPLGRMSPPETSTAPASNVVQLPRVIALREVTVECSDGTCSKVEPGASLVLTEALPAGLWCGFPESAGSDFTGYFRARTVLTRRWVVRPVGLSPHSRHFVGLRIQALLEGIQSFNRGQLVPVQDANPVDAEIAPSVSKTPQSAQENVEISTTPAQEHTGSSIPVPAPLAESLVADIAYTTVDAVIASVLGERDRLALRTHVSELVDELCANAVQRATSGDRQHSDKRPPSRSSSIPLAAVVSGAVNQSLAGKSLPTRVAPGTTPVVDKRIDVVVANNRRRAEEGDPWAQTRLGIRYLEGQGVEKDPVEAEVWLRKAASGGYQPAARQLEQLDFLRQLGAPLGPTKRSRAAALNASLKFRSLRRGARVNFGMELNKGFEAELQLGMAAVAKGLYKLAILPFKRCRLLRPDDPMYVTVLATCVFNLWLSVLTVLSILTVCALPFVTLHICLANFDSNCQGGIQPGLLLCVAGAGSRRHTLAQ
jgi:hypothetical protein